MHYSATTPENALYIQGYQHGRQEAEDAQAEYVVLAPEPEDYVEPAVAITIDTYELGENDKKTKTLSHIFYGDDLQRAAAIAHSHLISDYFYSSSFVGEMSWRNKTLRFTNCGQIVGVYNLSEAEAAELLGKLIQAAQEIHQEQDRDAIGKVVNQLSLKFK
jgi:hypothetical protein